MTISEEIDARVQSIFANQWSYIDARVIPETKNIGLGNYGKKLTATVLYADLDDSTNLVRNHSVEFAAEIYKAFLYCAAKLVIRFNGSIRAYDGDRVMGIFQGDNANTDAVKAALKLKWVVDNIVSKRLSRQYPRKAYQLKYTVGIDCSQLLAVRSGIRNSNDLAWIGDAANLAAKLNNLPSDYSTWITHRVFDELVDVAKFGGHPSQSMWEKRSWTAMGDMTIYRSNWSWAL